MDTRELLEKEIVIVYENGTKKQRFRGERHRKGCLSAIERVNGDKEGWVNGKHHRGGGLPAIECANGEKEYFGYHNVF